MTPEELLRIERSLGVTLPVAYKTLLEKFPIPACAGNTHTAVWDDAEKLIEYNRELRAGAPGGVKPWPNQFFAIGRDEGGSSEALDLRTGELWWADHSHLDGAGSYKHPETFEAWAAKYLDGLREDLAGEGIDPQGTPAQRTAEEARLSREGCRHDLGCLVVFLLVGMIAVLIQQWLRK